ncbi:hypothetical protein, partial [Streptomyces sp. SID13666]|uniref:hypothetical protein n=1 Tax=Streptomyces sp. SID13666 TaxID=2706054 RepID=UPI001941543B
DSPLASGEVGLLAGGFAGNTNSSPAIRFDNFEITDSQVFTVVRSQNGVTKAQSAGTAIRLAKPSITSL